ncbi:peptidylprolyl isomerase [Rhodovulum sp. DZ06]|uniref:peptidylprolyl isomerase n=1 Tax=Rhodovulum sp. DZ06 TaxID=3425126 RepID=UPI003D348874
MLAFFRKAGQTWVFKGLFALLILSFAVWGIGDVNFAGTPKVAEVADEEITVEDFAEALSREMQSLSQRAQRRVTVDEAQAAGLPQILLARLVRDAALNGEAHARGVSASDADVRRAITDSPSFAGVDGSFNEEQYRFVIDRLGFRPEEFEADMRKGLARDVLTYSVAGGAKGVPGLAADLAAHAMETRRIALIQLSPDQAEAPAAPTEDEVKAFIDANRAAYMKPETRAVRWIAIDPAAVAEGIEIPEEDLRAAYDAEKARFERPEMRILDQLAYPDEAAARAALARVEAGETDFAGLAAERDLTLDDASLGEGPREAFPEAVAEAGFATDATGVIGPVAGAFGPTLVNVRGITAASTLPYEEAKTVLRAELAAERASEAAVHIAEDAADAVAAGAGLTGLANDLGLTVHEAAALPEAGDAEAGPLATDPLFLEEVFAAAPGEERDIIETAAGGFAMVMVDAVDPAAPLSFEAARADAEAAMETARRLDALEAQAEEAVAALSGGETPEAVAARFGAEVQMVGPIRRTGGVGEIDVNLLDKLFAVEAGGAALLRTDDGVSIGKVEEVIPADLRGAVVEQQIRQFEEQLAASTGQDLYAYFAAALQDRANASVNQAALERAVNALR